MQKFSFLLCLLSFASCSYQPKEAAEKNALYFDIPGYFRQESQRLAHKGVPIAKTVWINGKSEHRRLKVNDWGKELSIFIDADINKGSWRGEFQISKRNQTSTAPDADTIVSYSSKNDKIPVKAIEILKSGDKIMSLKIFILNANDLYTSTDSLTYIPDSLYEIRKTQDIRVVGKKTIRVIGKF